MLLICEPHYIIIRPWLITCDTYLGICPNRLYAIGVKQGFFRWSIKLIACTNMNTGHLGLYARARPGLFRLVFGFTERAQHIWFVCYIGDFTGGGFVILGQAVFSDDDHTTQYYDTQTYHSYCKQHTVPRTLAKALTGHGSSHMNRQSNWKIKLVTDAGDSPQTQHTSSIEQSVF